jgi:hypothetical protein
MVPLLITSQERPVSLVGDRAIGLKLLLLDAIA